jgi:hypothetical protein
MVCKHVLSWFGLLVIAIINGAIRDFVYKPYLGDLIAHQVSTAIGIILFGIFIWYISKRWPVECNQLAINFVYGSFFTSS